MEFTIQQVCLGLQAYFHLELQKYVHLDLDKIEIAVTAIC